MKQVLLTVIGTFVGFAAGVFAGVWMQRHQPVPPPPMGIMGEIRDVPVGGNNQTPFPHGRPEELKAQIEKMQPEIDAFRKKLDPIKSQFKDGLDAILTPAQREKLTAFSERGPPPSNSGSPTSPPPQHSRSWHSHDGLESLFPIVLVQNTLERLSEELSLTDEQKLKVRALLLERRTQFLDLVDHSPPPSLRLGRLAPLVPQGSPSAK